MSQKVEKKGKKDQEDRLLWKKNEVADYEATSYSIFYNNSLFLFMLLIASFIVFKNFFTQPEPRPFANSDKLMLLSFPVVIC